MATPIVRSLAFRLNRIANPASDRWHKRPTALLGGVAIVLATVTGLAAAMFLVGVELGFPLVSYLISPMFYLEPND